MCGIAGYWVKDGDETPFRGWLPDALTRLRHRGPDDRGTWQSGTGVGLGQTRLSILDLSPHGHQPMFSPDGRLAIVFNGEVYNFKEIRFDLEALGHSFKGTGDTEVILAAFAQWGVEKAVRRFIGMFAIALWDGRQRELTLIRDRLGVKPLYYAWDGKVLCFGSELKALRAFGHWKPEIDHDGLQDFFQFGYINAPRSVYRQVRKLPPGHLLRLRVEGGVVLSRYWSAVDRLGEELKGDDQSLSEELESLMVDAFKLRMVSDVPVGVFLSGGTDSSLVTAILQKHVGNIHTFTIGFNEASHDESGQAKALARHLGTIHQEQILSEREAMNILPLWISLCDEPFGDASGIPTYLVSKLASAKAKVVLSADGGDEVFWGYRAYSDLLAKEESRRKMPALLRTCIGSGIASAPFRALGSASISGLMPRSLGGPLYEKICRPISKAIQYYSAATSGAVYELGVSVWSGQELQQLIGGSRQIRETADSFPGTFAEQMAQWDLENYMPGDILAKVDRATMAVSIEGREPLIDHRLVEFGVRLPMRLRKGPLGGKHMLKEILHRYVPRQMVERPKQGFGIPLKKWLTNDFRDMLQDHLSPASVGRQGLLNPKSVDTTLKRLALGSDHAARQAWLLLLCQMWAKEWM